MGRFTVYVHVMPKPGVADPPGEATRNALHALGFGEVREVRMGRRIQLALEAPGQAEAAGRARAMAQQLLANPVLESFEVHVEVEAERGAQP